MSTSFLESGVLMPQAGPQEMFASTVADIAIYGGAAGGGKTMALVMEPLRHIQREGFSGTIFRRTYPEIMMPGGLWDTASMVYPALGGVPRLSDCEFIWPQYGSRVKMAHMQHEKDKFAWQSSQLPLIELDELTHFTESQFWYMLSRNRLGRPMGGLRPYVRAACNPAYQSWVERLIAWWIDQETGLAIPERSGVLRWFIRLNGAVHWANSSQELTAKFGPKVMPKSLTFIASNVYDNKLLLEADPGYLANLQALPSFERSQLLEGNWKTAPTAGTRFKRHWFEVKDDAPPMKRVVRYWDRAGTEVSEKNNDPDYTAGVKQGLGEDGYVWILDVRRDRLTPGGVKRMISNTHAEDGPNVELWLEQDPGQAGKAERDDYADDFKKYGVRFHKPTGSKWVRSGPLSAAAENHRVRVLRGPWNKDFFDELEAFRDPDTLMPGETETHDDQVDGASGGFNVLHIEHTPKIRSV